MQLIAMAIKPTRRQKSKLANQISESYGNRRLSLSAACLALRGSFKRQERQMFHSAPLLRMLGLGAGARFTLQSRCAFELIFGAAFL